MAKLTTEDHIAKALADPELFASARFHHQKSKAFQAALKFAKRASLFREIDGAEYLVGFKKTARDAKLAYNFLSQIKGAKGLIVFVSGKPEKITWRILNVIECYAKAMALKNPKAYCHVVTDRLFEKPHKAMRMNVRLQYDGAGDDETPALCPCRDIEGFLNLARDAGHSFVDQIIATAEDKKQSLCPLFNAEDFKELMPEPPKYW